MVMGSRDGSLPPASRSITPKGAAANLASGGEAPVATLSGKLAALAKARPLLSLSPAGICRVNCAFSARG